VLPKDRPLPALKAVWHPGCLKCTTCSTTLNVRSLESYQNLPYCRSHRPNPTSTAVKATETIQMKNAMAVPKPSRKEQGIDKTARMTFAPGQIQQDQTKGYGSPSASYNSEPTPKVQTGGSIKDRIKNLTVSNETSQSQPPQRSQPSSQPKSQPQQPKYVPPKREPTPEPEPEPEVQYEETTYEEQTYEEQTYEEQAPEEQQYEQQEEQQEEQQYEQQYEEGGEQQYEQQYEEGDQQYEQEQQYYEEGGEQPQEDWN
jgi:hypothetical protein